MENTGNDNYEKVIVNIIIENWRLMKLFIKVSSKLNPIENNRYLNQIRYFIKTIHNNLEEVQMKIVNLEGQKYDSGMAATALNIDEFNIDDELMVEQMLEPLIMKNGQILKQAVINLKKVNQ